MRRISTRTMRGVMGAMLLLGLAACGAPQANLDGERVSRGLPSGAAIDAPQVQPAQQNYTVTEINVSVPRTLRVSERNSFYPGGDIVWREDPIGDRHQQVADIVYAGLAKGAEALDGLRPVILDVEVTRFHALTEKARYTVGGVHAIQFMLTIRDAETGAVIEPEKKVVADFPALGGMAAIAAEQRGMTQKVRITGQLAHVIKEELSSAEGYRADSNGFFGALNQL
jgi:hypothetical protein